MSKGKKETKVVEVVKTGNLSIKVNANTENESLEELKIIFNEMLKVIAEKVSTDINKIDKWQGGDIIVYKKQNGIVSDNRNKKGISMPYLSAIFKATMIELAEIIFIS